MIRIHVRYPLGDGRIVLRTDRDWEADVEPADVEENHQCTLFELPEDGPFVYFKPVLLGEEGLRWSVGANSLAFPSDNGPFEVYPYFDGDASCSACSVHRLLDPETGDHHDYRVFYPPGYAENGLRRYPVVYMQDGQNLFFPEEAYQGAHWRVAETLALLDDMNLLQQVIVVGVYPGDRTEDYTLPGYERYGRFLVEHLKPRIDAEFRTLPAPERTAVMGSSLGGVVSLYLAWEHPAAFGMAACMSSTFGWKDDLLERVASEPKRAVKVYLDSGWPSDNFEVTRNMRERLLDRGFQDGVDLCYFAFPRALHNESSWAMRLHIPLQHFFGQRPVASHPH